MLRRFCDREQTQKVIRPKSFFYEGKRNVPVEDLSVPPTVLRDVEKLGQRTVVDPAWSIRSRQMTIDGTTYGVGETVQTSTGIFKIGDFLTVRIFTDDCWKGVSLFKGNKFTETQPVDEILQKKIS